MWRLASLTRSDAAAAAALYARCFDPVTGGRPWTQRDFEELLDGTGVCGYGLDDASGRHGLAILRTVADEAEIVTVGVVPDRRRRGGAAYLLQGMLATAARSGARAMFLEVAEDNSAAFALYAEHGFQVVGRRPGYYARPDRPAVAAIVMRREIEV